MFLSKTLGALMQVEKKETETLWTLRTLAGHFVASFIDLVIVQSMNII